MADDGNIADLVTQASTIVVGFKNTVYLDCIKAIKDSKKPYSIDPTAKPEKQEAAKKEYEQLKQNTYAAIDLAITAGSTLITQISTLHKQAIEYAKTTYPKGIASAWAQSSSFEDCTKVMRQYIEDLGFKKKQIDVRLKVGDSPTTLIDRINNLTNQYKPTHKFE